MKNYYDLQADDVTFEEGDVVWFHNPRKKVELSPKLMHPWEGPYTITKVLNNIAYRIQLMSRSKAKVVHGNWMGKYMYVGEPGSQIHNPTM